MAVGKLTQHGREVIYTDVAEVTSANIADIITEAIPIHMRNVASIDYLWNYYRGIQPILDKESETRPSINHKPVENHAHEIVTFKTGYLMGEPVQYVKHGDDESITEDILKLNEYAFTENRAEKDKLLADWFYICGTSYKMILPNPNAGEDEGESPFHIYVLDPRNAFVVYSTALGNEPMVGVVVTGLEDGSALYTCYTKNRVFKLEAPGVGLTSFVDVHNNSSFRRLSLRSEEQHIMRDVPIIEYAANAGRIGSFEVALPLLDEINQVLSRRMDGLDRFVEAYIVFKGMELDEESMAQLRDLGGIGVPPDGDVSYITQELKQDQIQTLADTLYQRVLDICGMPNRNGGSSTSDNGIAVIYRDGWSTAETHAQGNEGMFKLSERRFLKIALNIANAYRGITLKVSDIEIRFSRRNYENILQKVQALIMMLGSDKIAPRLAYAHCGLFVDPDTAWEESQAYLDELTEERAGEMQREIEAAEASAKSTFAQS